MDWVMIQVFFIEAVIGVALFVLGGVILLTVAHKFRKEEQEEKMSFIKDALASKIARLMVASVSEIMEGMPVLIEGAIEQLKEEE